MNFDFFKNTLSLMSISYGINVENIIIFAQCLLILKQLDIQIKTIQCTIFNRKL